MIEFSIPPKPGEVTLDRQKTIDLLYLRGHTQNREALIAGAGFAIGALLMQECETIGDANEIVGEITDQATQAFEFHNQNFAPSQVDTLRLSSILHYGIEQGRITAIDVNA